MRKGAGERCCVYSKAEGSEGSERLSVVQETLKTGYKLKVPVGPYP